MPPPQNRSNRNHALAIISLSAISDRFTVSPHFRVAEPFCRILLFHTVRPFLSSSPSGRKAWRRGGAETNRRAESKLSLHGNPGPCFLGRLHPGLRFPGSIVFAKYDRGRNENYTPFFPPPSSSSSSSSFPHSLASRNALFPPRRPLRFPLSRGPPSFSLPSLPLPRRRGRSPLYAVVVGERSWTGDEEARSRVEKRK